MHGLTEPPVVPLAVNDGHCLALVKGQLGWLGCYAVCNGNVWVAQAEHLKERERDRQTKNERKRERDRENRRQRERDRDGGRERWRQRRSQRETERERERAR